ncbi:MAG TPA: hypothetical protein VFA32_02510 [Dehalococcoidia bacterium]|nr:hypothetical protein [Dehalococcoidia bacterium]
MAGASLSQATYQVAENDLEFMVLDKTDIPQEFRGYQVVREGVLSNEMMAEHGFASSTAARFRTAGRINGFMREFGATSNMPVFDGFNFVGATVAHLFDTPESVSGWMYDVFIKDFESNVGESVGEDHQLISVERLEPAGLFDESVALKVLQGGSMGLMSSTVVDFRVGRILGVAFVGAVGDHQRLDLANRLAQALEKRIVRVVLGAI